MATKEADKTLSRTEAIEAYSKLRARAKNAQAQAKREGELLIEDLLTVASGAGVGYLMGQRHAQGAEDAISDNHEPGSEAYEEKVADAGQVAGIDLDLIIGGVGTAAGMMKLGGKMSNTVRKVGIGALTSYASRLAYEKGGDSVRDSDEE